MSERLNVLVSKTGIPKGIMGSNPIPSAKSKKGKSYWLSFLNIIKCIKKQKSQHWLWYIIWRRRKKCKDITKCSTNNSLFIYDHIGIDTKYSKTLELIWHFYHNIQYVFILNDNLADIPEVNKFNIDLFFKNIEIK